MKIDIVAYSDLHQPQSRALLASALRDKGIVGIQGIPEFEQKSADYINAIRAFSALPEDVKQHYAPKREAGETEGYELGAEWFKNSQGEWQIDDKKASYYAWVPNQTKNRWPTEVNLRDPYLAVASLIFSVGKEVLQATGLLENMATIHADDLTGHGRMLHYHKVGDATYENPDWCGAHLDHGVLTALMPAYYFRDGQPIQEPDEAGLFIMPTGSDTFEKTYADQSVLLFQTGEFGQIISNDHIRATRHIVKKAKGDIERYTLAIFLDPPNTLVTRSNSVLTQDERYQTNQNVEGDIEYGKWASASYERYLAATKKN